MNGLAEKLYLKSPVFIQNILVTLYGIKLYKERYGKTEKKHLNMLLETEKMSAEMMLEWQEHRFLKIAKDAIENVPFYRDWAKENGIKSADILSIEDVKLFPILNKEKVRANPENFVSESHSKKTLFKLYTSGTSGSPLTVYSDSNSRTLHYAFFSRLRSWFGLGRRSRRATLFGRIIMLPESNSPPFWRFDYAQNNLLMSSYHLSDSNLLYYYKKLKDYDPLEIIGYPSSLYLIAEYINRKGLSKLNTKLVISTAETLMEYQRESIEKAFEGPLVDQYGCTEMAFFASQCEFGRMHFHPEHGIVEVMDLGRAVVGAPGSLVVTGLVNSAMPLIRYEVGDRVIISESICECKRSFPVIEQVIGRVDDIIYSQEGTPVGRLDPIFKGGIGIKAAKVLQLESSEIIVYIEASNEFNNENEAILVAELRKRVGSKLAITVKRVDCLPKDRNGKFKAVESKYSPQ
ncbi:hypothetical protein [Marinobacter sp. BGYM27]|uniref:phenylacetate--CoA ligase family protein n=1 Tax=Marinobacter sp. BGYM27 TaxID=2975597 RepID=UPI0021A26A34|nr:hypothetical protein [Marinobacter sp. BGYM27]MDG5499005.1 hypothetical protein [Marinobacter sp. BGYM27]